MNLIGIGTLVVILASLPIILDIDELKTWVENAGPWIPLAFIAVKALTIIVIPFTGAAVYPLVGLLFGLWPGLAYVAMGDFIGFSVAFWVSRLFGQQFVGRFIERREGSLFAQIVEQVETSKGFLQVALTFLLMPELLSYGAGLTKLRYRVFILILWPLWTIIATLLVLVGWFFNLTDHQLVITFFIPAAAVATFVIGGLFFTRNLLARRKSDDNPQ